MVSNIHNESVEIKNYLEKNLYEQEQQTIELSFKLHKIVSIINTTQLINSSTTKTVKNRTTHNTMRNRCRLNFFAFSQFHRSSPCFRLSILSHGSTPISELACLIIPSVTVVHFLSLRFLIVHRLSDSTVLLGLTWCLEKSFANNETINSI